jgi:acyl-CoA reductase-like NAD-dependent aldehyde dehydrogenase
MNSVPSEIANVDLIVRGKLRPSSSGQRWRITSPATGDVVGSVASATREDLLEGDRKCA